MLWKLTRRSLRARPFRFILTTFAVLLGVAFVTAAFVLSDSLQRVFEQVGSSIASPLDAQVRGVDPLAEPGDTAFDAQRPPIPESVLDTVRDVPGVELAAGSVGGFVSASTAAGESITPGQAPVLGFNWGEENAELADFRVLDGREPGEGTVAVDIAAADAYDLAIGDEIDVRGPGASGTYQISGIVEFGEDNQNTGGAYFVLMDLPTAQATFNLAGRFQTIDIKAAEGVNDAELLDRLAQAVPDGVEVISGQTVGAEFSDAFNQIVSIFRNLLLGFAGVALFVAIFLLTNVFNITLGQRLRELALLRAIGARNAQVTRSVMLEGLLIGVVGSVLGAIGGIGVGALLKFLFSQAGSGLPAGPLVLSARTWLVAFAVGIGVTLLTSTLPAVRAGRVPPMAALREGASLTAGRPRRRVLVGAVLTAIGAVLLGTTLFGDPGSTASLLTGLIGGALLVFLGVAFLSPLVARPAALGIGWPLTVLGVAARLGRGNAARNPLRTSRTAFALMIGLALVSMVGVVGESIQRSFAEQIDRGITADFFMTTGNGASFSPQLAADLSELPEVSDVTTFRLGRMKVGDETKSVTAVQADGFARTVNLGVSSGSASDLTDGGLLIHADVAADRDLSVGDTVTVTFPGTTASAAGDTVDLTVQAVFDDSAGGAVGNWVISQGTFVEHYPPDLQNDAYGGFSLAPGVDLDAAAPAIAAVTDRYPDVKVEDRAEFKASQESQLDQLLFIVYALLLFSLVIAALGIAITLALSVFERTRELGLLRAVGERKGQVWVMVISESVIVSTFGALLGLALGTVFGLAIVTALPASVVTVTAFPVALFVVVLLGAAAVGVGAALVPAFRASRLKVLDAIAYE